MSESLDADSRSSENHRATTELPIVSENFGRNSFVWYGHLGPVNPNQPVEGLNGNEGVIVDRSRYLIGRSKNAHLSLPTIDISWEHACIRSSENAFYLEDLGSSFGTYLNGDRILASRLTDGDILRFGKKTVMRFERRATRSNRLFEGVDAILPQIEMRPRDRMTITFWGCRGSMPTSGPQTEAYGGNTTCVEIRYRNSLNLIDAGTGITKFSRHALREFGDQPLHIRQFFTHLHWDHIQGFPFFSQAYSPHTRLDIYEVNDGRGTIRETLRQQMQGQFFPIPMDAMRAQIEFQNLDEIPDEDGLSVRKFLLPHPGGAYAYRFEAGDESFIFASDCELDQIVENRDEIREDLTKTRKFPAEVLEYFNEVDLLAIDCQYTDQMYRDRIGWGHNSVSAVIDFCTQVRPKHVALTHHDPDSDDRSVRRMVEMIDRALRTSLGRSAPHVSAAREELTLFAANPRLQKS